ncbi:MAG: UDP-N-acetylglucosamine--N-acetylmuramyl-(pentapeptide) pyrophosphoryl-undecaprenol N-acetylglucosamine transferase [Candidatus Margulisiibacteriota bacterium]
MKLLIAAGGTGGHIYPALAVAEEYLRRSASHEVLFIASRHGMESCIIEQSAFLKGLAPRRHRVQFIPEVRFSRQLNLRSVFAPWVAIAAWWQSLWIIKNFGPQAILVTGGMSVLPVALAAYFLRTPVLVQEQNVILGFTNRICSHFAKVILLAFNETKRYFKSDRSLVVGNPVRANILQAQRADAVKHLGLSSDKVKVLVWGGSQGARAINQVVLSIINGGVPDNLEIIHIIGRRDFENVMHTIDPSVDPKALRDRQELLQIQRVPRYFLVDYLDDVSGVLAAADLVVGRAGATGLAEMIARSLPGILIPFPYAADDHQRLNAQVLVNLGAAELLEEKDLSAAALLARIQDLVLPERRLPMSQKMSELHFADSAARVVDIIFEVSKNEAVT